MPAGVKDANELHVRDRDGFLSAFERQRSVALPFAISSAVASAPDLCIEKDGLTCTLANEIQAEHHFARLKSGQLYYYQDGVYAAGAEELIAQCVKRLLKDWRETSRWNAGLARQVNVYLSADAPQLPDTPSTDTLNVSNGLLDIPSGRLRPHNPNHLAVLQLPVSFDPAADCPGWEEFVGEVFPFDSQELAFEIAGLLMVPDVRFHKAFLLKGPGGTGKTTYLESLRSFLGPDNVSSISLEMLEERFQTYGLVGKLANISGEQKFQTMSTARLFKQIVGGDFIQVEKKHEQAFSYKPFARLLFATNQYPRVAEPDSAFYDRWCVVEFERVFRGTTHEVLDLRSRLTQPSELSGLLNRAVQGYRRICAAGRLADSDSMRVAMERFVVVSNDLLAFLQSQTVGDAQAFVKTEDLVGNYNAWRCRRGLAEIIPSAFGKAMADRGIRSVQRTQPDGSRPHGYQGIRLLEHDWRQTATAGERVRDEVAEVS